MRATNMYTERKDYEYKEGNVAVHAKIIVYIICGGLGVVYICAPIENVII
jgi:hypothetical protein